MKKIVLDPKMVLKMARNGATDEEIAAELDCRVSTLPNRASKELKRGRLLMRMDIRKAQLKLALDGNQAMLSFLGKQYLGQTTQGNGADAEPEVPQATGKMTTRELRRLVKS